MSTDRVCPLTVERMRDHTGGMEKFSLEALARVLMKSAATAPAGRAAETVYGGHEHVLRQTLIALTANTAMSEHENPGEATLQVMIGRVRLDAPSDGFVRSVLRTSRRGRRMVIGTRSPPALPRGGADSPAAGVPPGPCGVTAVVARRR